MDSRTEFGVAWIASPFGPLKVVANAAGVTSVEWLSEWGTGATHVTAPDSGGSDPHSESEHMAACAAAELSEYFSGQRQRFTIPVVLHGTAFQTSVWHALKDIPYGETCSYRDIAEKVGSAKAVRAVGQANRRNPIPILLPCHRVIGSDGKLVGYSGKNTGLKAQLLDLERQFAYSSP